MDTEELRTALSDAGLSPYQVAAYVAVLERGEAAATEIATAADVPAPRIYDVVGDLERAGYVETYEQGTLRVRAHDPTDALDLRERAKRFEAAAMEAERRFSRPSPAIEGSGASVVSRFETVLEGARHAIANATDQVQVSVTPAQFNSLRAALENAHERGVNVRLSVNTDPTDDREPTVPSDGPIATDALAMTCTEARHRPLPAPFLAIVDRTTACFAPHPEAADRYGVLIEDRTHAYVFHWYFLSCLWEAFDTVYDDRPAEPPIEYVDVRQCIREIEPVLGDGAEVVARIDGRETDSGESVSLAGRITAVRYAGEPVEGSAIPLVRLAGRATIDMDTGTETREIGGWGAIVEPIEATRITIERIDHES